MAFGPTTDSENTQPQRRSNNKIWEKIDKTFPSQTTSDFVDTVNLLPPLEGVDKIWHA